MTSTFKIGTAGCDGQFSSPLFPDSLNISCVFPTIFVFYLNDLLSEALSLILSIFSL